ncbi:MAG TPA: LacI family DNA-binding transcriptional regulator, partial [Terracidiphilus sp.]|nr:LacI family DNA-binding transcriptional regulator [Terracidiphilus sp.]
ATVREPLRKRVMDAVEAVGYQPSQLARGLRRDKTNMIGMVIPDVTNPFFPAVVRGAEDIAFANGYRLMLCNTDNDHAKEIAHLNELRTYLPSGLIVIPSNFSDLTAQAASYRKAGTAVVCVDRLPRDWNGDSVTADNEKGAYEATNYVLRQGHRRMAMITGPHHLTNSQNRLKGFKRALQEKGLHIGPEYVQEASFDKHGGYLKALMLLRMIGRPTAIFAGNDMIAFGALLAFRELGLRCPEDISLIGFDNLDLAEMTSPPLSSVSQPGYQMGTAAAQILIDRVRGDHGPAKHIVLETALKIRDSVGVPAAEEREGTVRSMGRPRAATAPRRGALKA